MRKHVSIVFPFVLVSLFANNISAQVIQNQPDKWQLVNGVKIETGISQPNVIKVEATDISPSTDSKNINDIPKKKGKTIKPQKVLKYGNQRSSQAIIKEDDE